VLEALGHDEAEAERVPVLARWRQRRQRRRQLGQRAGLPEGDRRGVQAEGLQQALGGLAGRGVFGQRFSGGLQRARPGVDPRVQALEQGQQQLRRLGEGGQQQAAAVGLHVHARGQQPRSPALGEELLEGVELRLSLVWRAFQPSQVVARPQLQAGGQLAHRGGRRAHPGPVPLERRLRGGLVAVNQLPRQRRGAASTGDHLELVAAREQTPGRPQLHPHLAFDHAHRRLQRGPLVAAQPSHEGGGHARRRRALGAQDLKAAALEDLDLRLRPAGGGGE
jgi:hypothetical protein